MGWCEFYQIEPWGLAVEDTLNAYQISTMVNLKIDSTTKPYDIKEFMLYKEPEKVEPVTHDNPEVLSELMISGLFGNNVVRFDKIKKEKE
jgi:hypothetical protein